MTIVSNPSADKEEKIEHIAKLLRQSKQAKLVFKYVYTGKRSFKSIREMRADIIGFNKNTYKAASSLAAEDIFDKEKRGVEVYYGKKEFYTHNRDKILRLSKNPQRLKKFPTKRKLSISQSNVFNLRTKPQVKFITIDGIGSFSRVKSISNESLPDVQKMSERTINKGICQIIETKEKKDWAGERNDIFSTNLQIKGKRIIAAFALKSARSVGGILTPKRMGKNGDQISRLFNGTAQIHLVVHNGVVHESIYDSMEAHAIQKSIETSNKIYYCIIDGKDFSRLVAAYPKAFSANDSK